MTASQAIVTYEWGDFKHDPRQVLARFFDAHLYFTNWGTRVLMFRFPPGLLDPDALVPYLMDDLIALSPEAKTPILGFTFQLEPKWEWIEDEDGSLARLVSLRDDILAGDYRCIYLAWLKAVCLQDPDEQATFEEPPVPAGLRRLTPALHQLAKFIDLDPHLIKSAAAASPAQAPKLSEAALRRAIGNLPRGEADDFLLRLLGGEAGLAHALRRRLQADLLAPPTADGGGRTIESLLAAAEQIKRDEAKQKAAAAEKRRIADLEKLAQTEEQAWQTVDALLAETRWKAHEQAVTQLQQLRGLADYQKTGAAFHRRVKQLRAKHQSRAALMKRFDRAGLA
ncbi:MAG: hypothetical protein IT317_06085 [Anaerolineales bacterium]|nr:hypothetical protein [Anaerolineales bacterium]